MEIIDIKDMIVAITGASVGAIFTGIVMWFYTRTDLGQKNSVLENVLNHSSEKLLILKSQLNSAEAEIKHAETEIKHLSPFKSKYEAVRSRLQSSKVVKDYYQPVILVGPRAVGKSSLLAQWRTPWSHSRLMATRTHNISTVPIYDFKQGKTEPHFADPEIYTDVHIHLKLKVHDFPGELQAQKSIIQQATQETFNLRNNTGKSLGVVLICLLNAEEAAESSLPQPTINYYNGDLFSNLRDLISHKRIGLERLVIVFNKYDLLKQKYPEKDDIFLLNKCLDVFGPVISPLRGTCNPEKVCEVFTVLSRDENTLSDNRGASIESI